jgi:hypothetical protein
MLFNFLQEFSHLTPAEQKVFLFCVEKKPYPLSYSGDLQEIAVATGLYYQTVRQAVYSFRQYPLLNKCVRYIHSDVSFPKIVSLDALFLVSESQRGTEEEEEAEDLRETLGPSADAAKDEQVTRTFPHGKQKHY